VLADVEAGALDAAVAELRAAGASAVGVVTDVADRAQMARLTEQALAEFGAGHLLCNNAGVGGDAGPVWELAPETWEWVLGVNLWGVINGIRAFVPLMLKQGSEGHVVNVASLAGLLTSPGIAPYYATKHAVVAISECLHHDLALAGARIKASVLCPGFVRTNIATSDRNRPAHLGIAPRPLGPAEAARAAFMRALIEQGTAPSQIADVVFAAVRDERFYVFPHPDALEAYRDYSATVAAQRNPVFDPARFAALKK
jgi:NAD(P)-dependent dehydrogenase (short-subunit alcohol dehydrogenase family)